MRNVFVLIVSVVLCAVWAAPSVSAGLTANDMAIAVPASEPLADSPGSLPDPIENPGESLSLLVTLYRAGHLVPLGILAAFFALTIASRKIAWLQGGYRRVGVSSVLGAAALLAVPAAEGATPNTSMLVGALIAAVSLALSPRKQE